MLNVHKHRLVIYLPFIIFLILGGCEGGNNQNLISGTEAILNGDFESGADGPQNWSQFCERLQPGFRFTWDDNEAKTGVKCIKLTTTKPNYTGWVQIVLLKANTDYRLSGWIKTQNIRHSTAFNHKMTHNIGANITVMDASASKRGGASKRSDASKGGDASGRGKKWRIHSSGLLGSNPWTYVELKFNSGSHTRVKIIAQLGIWGGPTTGTAWFDDLKLQKI